MLDVSFKACAAQGEARGSEFPLDVGSLSWEWGLWQDHLSVSPAYLILGFLSFAWCIGVTQVVLDFFFFFLKEIVLYVTADSVYPCVWFATLN